MADFALPSSLKTTFAEMVAQNAAGAAETIRTSFADLLGATATLFNDPIDLLSEMSGFTGLPGRSRTTVGQVLDALAEEKSYLNPEAFSLKTLRSARLVMGQVLKTVMLTNIMARQFLNGTLDPTVADLSVSQGKFSKIAKTWNQSCDQLGEVLEKMRYLYEYVEDNEDAGTYGPPQNPLLPANPLIKQLRARMEIQLELASLCREAQQCLMSMQRSASALDKSLTKLAIRFSP